MKKKTFTINNKKYQAKEIDTNALCMFEDCGLALSDISKIEKKTFSFVRAYVAFCGNIDMEEAGVELNNHMINGEDLTDVIETFTEALQESRFFQALIKNAEKKNTTATE